MTQLVEPITLHLPCGGIAKFVEPGSMKYQCETCGYEGVAGGEDNPCGLVEEKYKSWEGQGDVEWTEDDDE
jgi:hypothetical protein